jgi:hypothetical protein
VVFSVDAHPVHQRPLPIRHQLALFIKHVPARVDRPAAAPGHEYEICCHSFDWIEPQTIFGRLIHGPSTRPLQLVQVLSVVKLLGEISGMKRPDG